jgi:hypothetical protein
MSASYIFKLAMLDKSIDRLEQPVNNLSIPIAVLEHEVNNLTVPEGNDQEAFLLAKRNLQQRLDRLKAVAYKFQSHQTAKL